MSRRVERADICIVGTGAAGGILAYRLASAGRQVLSLEQGAEIDNAYFTNGLPPEDEEHYGIAADRPWPTPPSDSFFYENAQANQLYARGDESSTSPDSAHLFQNRQVFRLNGKQNLWGGVVLRHSVRDFRSRDFGDGDLNWPVGYADLEPHYSAIEKLIGVCGTREGLEALPDGEFLRPPPPLRPADRLLLASLPRVRGATLRAIPNRKAIETRPGMPNTCRSCGLCVYGCRFGSIYKFSSHLLPQIRERPNYRIICRTKVLRLRRVEGSTRIEAAECLDTRTGEPWEVQARTFILAAGALETPRILLNSPDAEWPHGLANSSGRLGRFLQDNVKVMVGGALWKLRGSRVAYSPGTGDHLLLPRFLFDNRGFRGGFQALAVHTLPWRPFYLDAASWIPPRLKDLLARRWFCAYLALLFSGKPEGRAENRLRVSDRRDAFGVPQVDVEYHWSENDRRMQQSMAWWGKKILRAASALVTWTFKDAVPGNSIHYAGTCGMAASPRAGVVDADCRTFDHPNLYLCDGGVMPDLSEKNPTLTIMALADRLAAHLEHELPVASPISRDLPQEAAPFHSLS
ncbi:MAG: GMC family oxidoreductase [Planctomycetes bacterium]|nr:GMC family oxidoreductase [Planctomycetota bacterium]